MKKFQWLSIVAVLLLLAACSKDDGQASLGSVNDGEAANGYGAIDHGVKENQEADDRDVGFSLIGDTIEEATGVPVEEKEDILNVFNVYIESFNEKDLDRYLNVLSTQTESFDYEEERAYTEEMFEGYDINREVTDVTIVKYAETEAQVFARLSTSVKQLSSGLETNEAGRQVTVMTKDEGEWKVASIHYMKNTTMED